MSAADDEQFEAELDGFPTGAGNSPMQSRDRLEILASQYSDRVRKGQQPSIEEYIRVYPELADGIRELFPMVAALENWKQDRESESLRQRMPDEFEIDQLGDCRIVREIGRGGMGVVFEALQGSFERRVAVKLLPWRLSMVPQWQERFEHEAQTIARLRHASIVPIYSFGTHQDYAYYVMQYVDGVSLARIIRILEQRESLTYAGAITTSSADEADALPESRKGLKRDSWKSFARIGVQVAQALRHAHREGVLHNDVKPANLLIDRQGRIFVTDFGLAQDVQPNEPTVDDERVTGTLRYMAPERFTGVSDVASDVYSLGVTLYELLTRRNAFEGDDRVAMLEEITDRGLPALRETDPDIPRDLSLIIEKCTARSPGDRYATAGELAADLLRFINDQPVKAMSSDGGIRRWLKWRR